MNIRCYHPTYASFCIQNIKTNIFIFIFIFIFILIIERGKDKIMKEGNQGGTEKANMIHLKL